MFLLPDVMLSSGVKLFDAIFVTIGSLTFGLGNSVKLYEKFSHFSQTEEQGASALCTQSSSDGQVFFNGAGGSSECDGANASNLVEVE